MSSSLCWFVLQCYTEHEECSTALNGPKACCSARVCMRRPQGWRCTIVFWPHLGLHRQALTSAGSAPICTDISQVCANILLTSAGGCTNILQTSAGDALTFTDISQICTNIDWHQLGMHRHLLTSAGSAPTFYKHQPGLHQHFTDIKWGCTDIYRHQPDLHQHLLTSAGDAPTFRGISHVLTLGGCAPTFYWHQLGIHRHFLTSARSAPACTDISRVCTIVYWRHLSLKPLFTDIRWVCTIIYSMTSPGHATSFICIIWVCITIYWHQMGRYPIHHVVAPAA